jgi:short-subunit dehydrogenase
VPIDAWIQILRLNVDGAIYSVGAVLPEMVARKSGHLAVVSSVAGYRGLPMSAAYSASKAAVTTFFESLRVDLRRHGIAVTAIHPGFITTPLTAKNKFPMPFLVETDDAARRIADAIDARKRWLRFPWQISWAITLASLVPGSTRAALTRRSMPPPKQP